jgi:hypothetical protein
MKNKKHLNKLVTELKSKCSKLDVNEAFYVLDKLLTATSNRVKL